MNRTAVVAILGLMVAAPAAAIDLTVTKVSGPTTGKAGSLVLVSTTVAAAAGGGNAGSFRVGIYLSPDANITIGDELIGSRTVTSLAAGKTSASSTMAVIAPNRNGTYYFGAIVDRLGAVTESNEANNALTGNATAITGPDLTVTAVSGSAVAAPGSSISVSTTVANATTGGMAGDQLVAIYLSTDPVITSADTLLGTREILFLGGGATSTGATTVTLPAGLTGQYYLGAIADDHGWVTETNENNNALAGNVIVIAGPDLSVWSTSGPAWAMPGTSISLFADVAAGAVGPPAGAWYVDFYLSTPPPGQGGGVTVAGATASTSSTGMVGVVYPILPEYPPIQLGAWLGRYTGLTAMAAFELRSISTTGTIPASASQGVWGVAAVVGSEGVDSDPTNNALATAAMDVSRILSGVDDGEVRSVVPVWIAYRLDAPGETSVEATLDGAPFQGPLAVSSEGDHVVEAALYGGADCLDPGPIVLAQLTTCSPIPAAILLGRETVHFSIDLSPPVIQVSGVNDGQVTAAAAVTPTFSASDPHLASVSSTLDGLPFVSGDAVAAEGDHVLIVTASDTVGHSSTQAVAFAIDRTPPVVSITGVTPGQVGPPPMAPVFAASDPHLVEVTATLDGAAFLSGSLVTSAGAHLLVVRAADGAGLVTESTVPFTVIGDVTAPEILVTGVTPGQVTSMSPVDICVAVSDQNLATWSATLDGLPVPGCFSVYLEGDHELAVTAQDAVGNLSSKLVGFALDFTAPQLAVSGVADGQVVDAPAVVVTYAMTDAHPAGVAATLNGAPFVTGEAVSVEGEYLLSVTGSDRAGQVTQQAWHFTIDRTAPVVTVAGVTDQQASRLPLTPVVTASDQTLATLTIILDGQPLVSGTPVASEGAHQLSVTATDRANHTVTVVVNFRIDTTAPAVGVVAPTGNSLLGTASAGMVVSVTDAGGVATVAANGASLVLEADGLWRGSVALIEGANTLTVIAIDRAGNSTTAVVTTARDTTAPQLSVTSPTEGALLGGASVVVSGTVSDAHAVTVTVNGSSAGLTGGVFSSTVTMAEGAQAITVVATDAAGNTATQVVHLTVDLTAPVIDVAGMADGQATNAASVILSYGASDANLESVSATLDGVTFASGSSVTAEGPHRLEVTARDRVGHTATRTVAFLVDRTAPMVTVTGASDGLVTQAAVTPVFQASDPYLATVAATLDGLPFTSGTPVSVEGAHMLVVAATDLAQNVQRVTIGFTILQDVTPPAIAVVGVTDGEVTARTAVDVIVEVTDPNLVTWAATLDNVSVSGVFSVYLEGDHELVVVASDSKGNTTTRTVRFAIDLTPPTIVVSGVSDGLVTNVASLVMSYTADDLHLGAVSATLDGVPFQGSVPVTDEGTHHLQVSASDQAGNPSSRSLTFSIDRTTPAVSIAGVSEGQAVRPPASPTYGATDPNLATLTATLDGLPFASGSAVTAEGVHQLVATATDRAGNSGSASVTFRVDATPPALTVSAPAPGSLVGGAEVAVVAGASDLGGVGGLTANGVVLTPGVDGSWRGQVPLVEGANTVVVIATDLAGNSAQVAVSVARDTVPPNLVITSPSEGAALPSGGVIVAGTVSDTTAVTLAVNGASVAATSGAFSTAVTLAEGAQVIDVTATDAAGNATQRVVHATIDLTDPTIDVVGVTDGQSSNAPALTVGYSATDANPESVTATLDALPFTSGAPVTAEGAHELVVTARDRAGRTATRTVRFILDRTAPAVTVTAPSGGLLLAQAVVEVVAQVDELRDLAGVSANGSALGKGVDGAWRGMVSLAEGPNTIVVTALDAAGNSGSASVTVSRDTTSPTLNVTSPSEGQEFPSGDVTVAGTAADSGGVTVTVNGSAVTLAASGAFLAPLSLPYGDRTITVVARDPAGNQQTQLRHVLIRGGPMQVTVVEPRAGFVTSASSVTVRGVVSGGAGGWSATVNGSAVSVASDGSYSVSVPLAVGAATVTVVASDLAGASATASVSGSRSDPGAPPPEPGVGDPVVTLALPADGSISAGRVPVDGSISGGTPPYQVSALGVAIPVNGAHFASSLELAEGDQLVSVRVVDAAGRQAIAQRSVSVDRTAPFLQVTRPSTASAEATESPYWIQGTAGDAHLASVTVNGQEVTLLGGTFGAAVSLVAGDNSVAITARDLAGNVQSTSVLLHVVALPPQVSILEPLDGAEAPQDVVRVRASVSSTNPIAVGGVVIGAGPATEVGGGWEADVKLGLADNSITVSATDTAGLTGSATVHVKYRDAGVEPLRVSGVDPADGATGVEPTALVTVAFNKPVQRASLDAGFTLSGSGGLLPGGIYLAPGGQTASFIAKAPLPEGQRLSVRLDGILPEKGPGMAAAFSSGFSVRPLRSRLFGLVLDDQLEPVAGARIEVEGSRKSVLTGPDGHWTILDVPGGAAPLRVVGPALGGVSSLATVQRRVFVEDAGDTQVPALVLVPVDGRSATFVDASRDVHLDFVNSLSPGPTLDVPANGLFFEDGKTSGFLTATRYPQFATPVPVDSSVRVDALWHIEPGGLRVTAPVTFTMPNATSLPKGRMVIVLAYDPDRRMIDRAGLGRVGEDGLVHGDQPITVKGLDYVGYSPLTEAQQALLESAAAGGSTSGKTGWLDPRVRPAAGPDQRPGWLRLLAAPFIGVAHAIEGVWNPFGLLDGQSASQLGYGGVKYAHGRIRSSYLEKQLDLQLDSATAGLVDQSAVVTMPYLLSVGFEAIGSETNQAVQASLSATRTGMALLPPSGTVWTTSGVGRAVLVTKVELSAKESTTLITLAGQAGSDRKSVRLEATLEAPPAPPAGAPPDADAAKKQKLTLRRIFDPGESVIPPISYFRNRLVTVDGGQSTSRGMSGDYGQFSIPVKSSGDAFVCTDFDFSNRYLPRKEVLPDGSTRIAYDPVTTGSPVCAVAYDMVTIPAFHRSDLVVDLRFLHGVLNFKGKDGTPVGGACSGGASTVRDPVTGDLTSIASADLATTEVFFFRDDDLKNPVARYAVAVPGDVSCQDAHASYTRLRIGPSNKYVRRQQEWCDAYAAAGGLTPDQQRWYDSECSARVRRESFSRLAAGDRLVVFAVNHATGYSGAKIVEVPKYSTTAFAPDGSCPEDASGPIRFEDAWSGLGPMEISRCLKQSVEVQADVDLYPPEIDVRVVRRMRAEGANTEPALHLVRHGGAAVRTDDYLKVSTHWRARLKPHTGLDLTVTSVTASPTSLAAGANLTVTTSVAGAGGDAGPFWVRLYLSKDPVVTRKDVEISARRVTALPRGGASTEATSITLSAGLGGKYYVGAIVDADAEVPEADETNNWLAGTVIEVAPAGGSEPVVADGCLDGGTCAISDDGKAGALLEKFCSELPARSDPAELERCKTAGLELMDVPAGVPPLMGHVVKVAGVVAEEPALTVFPVSPGAGTVNIQVAGNCWDGTKYQACNLPNANFYVHIVGNPVFTRDANGNGIIDPGEPTLAPPGFQDGQGEGPPGLPVKAVGLKDVYLGWNDQGTPVERYDVAREHEFKVLGISRTSLTANPVDAPRRVDQPPAGQSPRATPADQTYELLLALLQPVDPGRAQTPVGGYRIRIGSDSFGVECAVKLDPVAQTITGDCGGESLMDVLSASDLVYAELFLSGNAENILYRYNFQGLSPRLDYLTAGSSYTSIKSVKDDVAGQPDLRRTVEQPAKASMFIRPADTGNATLSFCLDEACSGSGSLLKSVKLTLQANGEYAMQELGGWWKASVVQSPHRGAGDSTQFELPLPPSLASVPGLDGDAKLVFAVVRPDVMAEPVSRYQLGRALARMEGAHLETGAQPSVHGVNLADGHLALDYEDLTLPELGSVVTFARRYDNQSNEAGPLGVGWSHTYDGFVVEEEEGRYAVVLAGQAHVFPRCTSDATAGTFQCASDRSHGARLTATKTGAAWAFVFQAADGSRYLFDRGSQLSKRKDPRSGAPTENPARRRWLLTRFEDGHGDQVGPNLGWTSVSYEPDSDRIQSVERHPGKVKLSFAYKVMSAADPKLTPVLRNLVRGGFRFVKSVTFTAGSVSHLLEYEQDDAGNLTVVRGPGIPRRIWRYAYERPIDLVARAGAGPGADTRALNNELLSATMLVDGGAEVRQEKTEYRRTCKAVSYAHVESCEVVDGVVLPGYGDEAIAIAYAGGTRTVTEPSVESDSAARPLVTTYQLNAYGNAKVVTVSSATPPVVTRQDWGSDVEDGWVRLEQETSPTGLKLTHGYEAGAQGLLEKSVTLTAVGVDTRAVRGVLAGTVLRQVEARDPRFGTPLLVTFPAADGTRYSEKTEFWPTGDVRSITVLDGQNRTVSQRSYTSYEDGVLRQEVDEVGRTIDHSGVDPSNPTPNPFGLAELVTITRAAPGAGEAAAPSTALALANRSIRYDDRGRMVRSEQIETGIAETWAYDALGRLTAHGVPGTPAQSWTYRYTEQADTVTVEQLLNGELIPRRKRVSKWGLPATEEFPYGAAGALASKVWTHQRGKLTRLVDERGVTHRYFYDGAGRLQSVKALAPPPTDPGAPAPSERVEFSWILDAAGKRTSVTDQNGLTTTIGHDLLGRPAFWSFGITGSKGEEEVTLDLGGAVTRRVLRGEGGEQALDYTVDPLGRTTLATSADGSVNQETTYDGAGKAKSVVDRVMELEEGFEYQDALGRLTRHWRKVQGAETTGSAELYHSETRDYTDGAGGSTVTASHSADWKDPAGTTGANTWKEELSLDGAGRVLARSTWVHGQKATRRTDYDAIGEVWREWEPGAAAAKVYDRDLSGHVTSVTDPVGNRTEYQVDATGLVLEQRGPLAGEVWTSAHDAFGQPASRSVAAFGTTPAGTWTYDWSALTGLLVERDPLGYTTERTHDARYRVVKEVKRDDGGTTTSANTFETNYKFTGSYVSEKSVQEGGARTVWSHVRDARGREQSRGEEWTAGTLGYSYQTQTGWSGRVATEARWYSTTITGADKRFTRRVVDSLGSVLVKDEGRSNLGQGGFTSNWAYDAAGRVVSATPAGSPSAAYLYSEGLLVKTMFGAVPEETTYTYYPNGQLHTETRPSGRIRTYQYEGRGLPTSERYGWAGDESVVSYQYDAAGNLKKLIKGNAANVGWDYEWGPRRELQLVTPPGGIGSTTYLFDASARLRSIRPQDYLSTSTTGGVEQTFESDYLGRTINRTFGVESWKTAWRDGRGTTSEPGNAARTVTKVIDGRGRLARAEFQPSDDVRSIDYSYTSLDQPLTVVESDWLKGRSVTYEYDSRDLLQFLTRGGSKLEYTYTDSGRMKSVAPVTWFGLGRGTATNYTYYPGNGRLESVSDGTNTVTHQWEPGGEFVTSLHDGLVDEARCYDGPGRLTRIIAVPSVNRIASCLNSWPDSDALVTYRYGYDDRGNRTSEDYAYSGSAALPTTYGYDPADRLTGVQYADGTAVLYRLGHDGSRLGEKDYSGYAGPLGPASFDATQSGLLARSSEYVFLGNGELQRKERIPVGDPGEPPTRWVERTWEWDPAGRLQAIKDASGQTRHVYTWDVASRMRAVTAPGGNAVYQYEPEGLKRWRGFQGEETEYVWNTTSVQGQQVNKGTPLAYAGLGPLASFAGDSRVVRDVLGSPVAKVGATATQRWRYGVWGDYRDENGVHPPPASNETMSFTGHQWDAAPELIYAQQRWYDPTVGRFVSRDPAPAAPGATSAINPYLYAAANPTAYVDPTGAVLVLPLVVTALGVALPAGASCVSHAHQTGTWVGCGDAALEAVPGATAGAGVDMAIQLVARLTPWGNALSGVSTLRKVLTRTGIAMVAGAGSGAAVAAIDGQDPAKAALAGAMWGGMGGLAMEGIFAAGGRAFGARALAFREDLKATSGGKADSFQYAQLKEWYRSQDPGYIGASAEGVASQINPRLSLRQAAFHRYQQDGGAMGLSRWVKATQGNPRYGTGFSSGYSDWERQLGRPRHGNDLRSLGRHDVYAIRAALTGEVLHFGETGRGFRQRLLEHERAFGKLGIDIEGVLLDTVESKAAAKAVELRYIKTYSRVFGERPRFNPVDH